MIDSKISIQGYKKRNEQPHQLILHQVVGAENVNHDARGEAKLKRPKIHAGGVFCQGGLCLESGSRQPQNRGARKERRKNAVPTTEETFKGVFHTGVTQVPEGTARTRRPLGQDK